MAGVSDNGVGGKLLSGIKCMYDDSEACVRINRVESDWFNINSEERQGCAMADWRSNLYMDEVRKELEVGLTRDSVRMMENGREWRVPYPLYEDDLVLCGESEESLRGLVERFGRVCKRRGLNVNADKSKVTVVSEDKPQCEVMLDGEQLEQVSEFK